MIWYLPIILGVGFSAGYWCGSWYTMRQVERRFRELRDRT